MGNVLATVALTMSLSAVAGCASARVPASAQDLSGCYFFELDAEARDFRLPRGIRLTNPALEGWPGIMQRGDVRVAVTLNETGEADYPFGYWLREGPAIEVGYPSGGAIILELERHGRELRGTARSLGDAMPLNPQAAVPEIQVLLERDACP